MRVLDKLQKLKQAQRSDWEAIQRLQRAKERAERKARQLEERFQISKRSETPDRRRSVESSAAAKRETLVIDEPASDDALTDDELAFGFEGDESLPPPHYEEDAAVASLLEKRVKAREVPISTVSGVADESQVVVVTANELEAQRKERIRQRSLQLLESSELPPRMALAASSGAEQVVSVKLKKQLAVEAEEQARKQRMKPKPVPDFGRLHGQWEALTKARKAAARLTSTAAAGGSETRLPPPPPREFFTSRAATLAELTAKKAERRRKQLEQEERERAAQRDAQEQEAVEAEQRQQRRKLAAKRVAAQVRASEQARVGSRSDYVSLRDVKQLAQQRAREFQRSLQASIKQNKARILGAVAAQPSLMERYATDLQREAHKKSALEAGILTDDEHDLACDIVAADQSDDDNDNDNDSDNDNDNDNDSDNDNDNDNDTDTDTDNDNDNDNSDNDNDNDKNDSDNDNDNNDNDAGDGGRKAKAQRYMRDDERLDVIRRVQSGEKQSDIASEILLEEALAMAPVAAVSVTTPGQQVWQGIDSISPYAAIGIGNGGYPLLRGFEDMMIDARTGFIGFGSHDAQLQARYLTYSLPSDLRSYNVLLVDDECVTGTAGLQAINVLCNEGVPEQAIVFVCVLAAREGVQNILSTFPGVRVVTAAVDPDVQRHSHPAIRPGCGVFLDRYYDAEAAFSRLI
ncbi:hypothetical protein PybrP1_009279 [[Pythium] brassicae (nom. inval.)]|nr:hypothetical protein PybrP1_009279 [[Pythium] brassicae (nom. inval.)]